MSPERFFLFRRQLGVAGRADNAAGGDRAQRTDFFRHGDHRADLRYRDFQFFDFFADRCAAASAGASSRGENHAGDAGRFQTLGYVFTDVRRVFDGGMGAAGGMDELVEFAEHTFAVELAHGVERHEAVGIAIGDRGVVARVNGVVFIGIEGIDAIDLESS